MGSNLCLRFEQATQVDTYIGSCGESSIDDYISHSTIPEEPITEIALGELVHDLIG